MRILILFLALLSAHAEAANERVENLNGKFLSVAGPNCWNSALYAAGLINGIRHTAADEFTSTLESPLCAEVSEKDRAAGDIAAFRRASADGRLAGGPFGSEVHGAILVDAQTAFSKNGTATKDGYHTESIDSLARFYQQVNKNDCRVVGVPREFCYLKVQYFRCASQVDSSTLRLKADAIASELNTFYLDSSSIADAAAFRDGIKSRINSLLAEINAIPAGSRDWKLELVEQELRSSYIFFF